MTLGELIEALGGKLAAGSAETIIEGVNSAEKAQVADLVFAEDAAAAQQALASQAGAVVLKPGVVSESPEHSTSPPLAVVEFKQPRLWFARAATLLKNANPAAGIHETAVIETGVKFGLNVAIGPCVVIGNNTEIGTGSRIAAGAVIGPNVRIGENCRIYPRVVIYAGATLGNSVVVHAGAVLGADGFGYVRDADTGAHTQFPQQGTLVIEDDVEIGANSTIDRGALDETRIRRGTKIDNLVHVGHNCDIGEDVILVALTGISGSCTIGKGAILAGQVGMGDHAHVGPGVILGGQAGVLPHKTVTNKGQKPGSVMWGTPARPLMQVLREQATLTRLAKRQETGNKKTRRSEEQGNRG